MNDFCRRLSIILACGALIMGPVAGCSHKSEETSDGRGENPGYRLEGFSILRDEEYAPQVVYVGECGDGYVAVILGHSTNALKGDNRSVVRLAEDGTLLSNCEIDVPGMHSYATSGDRMLCLGYDALYEVYPEDGSYCSIAECSDAMAVSGFDGGYALLYDGKIEIYDNDDNMTHTISDASATDYPSFADPLFNIGDDLFLVTGSWQNGYTYYSVDEEGERLVKIFENGDSDIANDSCFGKYAMTEDAVYLVHPDTEKLELLLKWDNTSELPPSLYGYREDYPVSEDTVICVYTEAGVAAEIQVYKYDPSITAN